LLRIYDYLRPLHLVPQGVSRQVRRRLGRRARGGVCETAL